MAHFAPRYRHADEEETVTRPLLRPAHWMLRREMDTDPSIELELDAATDPQGELPDFSYDEEWVGTNELPRPPSSFETTITRPRVQRKSSEPLPLVNVRRPQHSAPSRSLPPLPSFARPSTPSRPALPPVPAFTRPINVAPKGVALAPLPPPPRLPAPPAPRCDDSVVAVREDLQVEWRDLDAAPTSPLSSPIPLVSGYRQRLETVRGIELDDQLRSFVESPPQIRYTPLPDSAPLEPTSLIVDSRPPPRSQTDWRVPISDIPPCTVSAPPPPPASEPRRNFRELWRAARSDAWTAFLMLPIAVSLVSIVVLTVTALASSSADAAKNANRRLVSATDERGAPLASATVFVDGVAKCQVTPCTLDLADGTHWVTISAPGYEAPPSRAIAGGKNGPQQIEFVLGKAALPQPVAEAPSVEAPPTQPAPPAREVAAVNAREAPVREAPQPRAERAVVRPREVASGESKLNINSIPAANVVLDGRPLGRTPKIGVPVTPGPHTVVFVSGKTRLVRGTVVGAGKTAVVAARF